MERVKKNIVEWRQEGETEQRERLAKTQRSRKEQMEGTVRDRDKRMK